MFIRHFSSRAFPFISLFFLSPIGPLPGSSPSRPSHTLSAEGDTSPVTEVNGALVSWRPCHQLSGRSHWTKHHILQQTTWILFHIVRCLLNCSVSLIGWELRFTSMMCACSSHTRATEPMWKSPLPTLLPSCDGFHPGVVERFRGRGNLSLYSSWQLKLLLL